MYVYKFNSVQTNDLLNCIVSIKWQYLKLSVYKQIISDSFESVTYKLFV